jgi:type IV secretion system protein VirB8
MKSMSKNAKNLDPKLEEDFNNKIDHSRLSKKEFQQKPKIKSWYSNRHQIVIAQRNILLFLAVLLMLSMTTATIFVKFVVSSKSLEPYVIEIEEKSGIPTIINQVTSQTLTADESIKKYFINQFVQSSIGYNPRTYKQDVEIIRLFTTEKIYKDFRQRIDPNILGVDSRINFKIKSIKFINPSAVQIRILKDIVSNVNKGSVTKSKNEIINMSFAFTNLTLNSKERLINPLSFQVNSFVITEETFE